MVVHDSVDEGGRGVVEDDGEDDVNSDQFRRVRPLCVVTRKSAFLLVLPPGLLVAVDSDVDDDDDDAAAVVDDMLTFRFRM